MNLNATFLRDRTQDRTLDAPLNKLANLALAIVLLHRHAPGSVGFRETLRETLVYARSLNLSPWSSDANSRKQELAEKLMGHLVVLAEEQGV